jgi:hypothetical protein
MLAQAATDPVDAIRRHDQDLQTLLKRYQPANAAQRDTLKHMINEMFSFPELGKRSLGKTWGTLGKADQDSFLVVFKKAVESSSMKRLENYRADSTRYAASVGEGDRTVRHGHGVPEREVVQGRLQAFPAEGRVAGLGPDPGRRVHAAHVQGPVRHHHREGRIPRSDVAAARQGRGGRLRSTSPSGSSRVWSSSWGPSSWFPCGRPCRWVGASAFRCSKSGLGHVAEAETPPRIPPTTREQVAGRWSCGRFPAAFPGKSPHGRSDQGPAHRTAPRGWLGGRSRRWDDSCPSSRADWTSGWEEWIPRCWEG